MNDTPPAGWYPDPQDASQQRYWDGAAWTEHTAAVAPQQAGFVQQQPVYAQPHGLGANAPDPWLWQSIVATVVCCVASNPFGLLGIPGIVAATKSQRAAGIGDATEAHRQAKLARTWTLVTVGSGLLILLAIVALFAFGIMAESVYY